MFLRRLAANRILCMTPARDGGRRTARSRGPLGLVVAALTVSWCTYAASTMFVTVLQMTNQRLLVAYPVAVLYSSFALLTVF